MIEKLIKFWNTDILHEIGTYCNNNSLKMVYGERATTSDLFACLMVCYILEVEAYPFDFNKKFGFT